MKIFKVLLDFVIFAVNDKVTFYRLILAQLTANPNYPTPDVSLYEAKAAVDAFELAILAAQDGSHTAISIMHDLDKSTTLIFRNLAHYVNRVANGDESKILSSGFNCSKQPVLHDKPALTVKDGPKSGTVILDAKKHPKGGAYKWQKSIKENPQLDSDWEDITITTQAHCTVEGLTPSTYVYFRYCVVTPTGITDYFAPVKKLIG